MSDRPRGEGWWQGTDGKWYPPYQGDQLKAPRVPPAGSEQRSDLPPPPPRPGWWLASDGNWYPPETSHRATSSQTARLARGYEQQQAAQAPRQRGGLWKVAGMLAVAAVGLFVVFAVAGGGSDTGERLEAERMCEQFIEDRLKAPTTAEFHTRNVERLEPVDGNDRWRVTGHVDSQNGFGAMIRSEFLCKMSDRGRQWRLEDLQVD